MKLVTVDQMRRIEAASDAQGHSYAALMERAGGAVARVVLAKFGKRSIGQSVNWSTDQSINRSTRQPIDQLPIDQLPVDQLPINQLPINQSPRIFVLVGPGNNGGDGLVAARHLHDAGAEVGVYLLKPREDADTHIAALRERSVFMANLPDDRGLRILRLWLSDCDVVVDALLGTGASRPLTGDLAKLLTAVSSAIAERRNAAPDLINLALPTPSTHTPLIVAVDGPTGLNYDTGELDPLTVPADVSVTFAYPKIGHTRFPGAGACGELIVADIGTDPKLADDVTAEIADPVLVRSLLPKRPANAHKGTFGKTLIVSGSTLYTGAPILAATAAYRAGAGLVTLAIPQSIHAIMAGKINEATFRPLPDQSGVLSAAAAAEVCELIETYDVALIGPGLTQEAQAFIEAFLALKTSTQLVLDADALNCLAQIDQWWTQVTGPSILTPSILTPHPGEMSRLTKLSLKAIEADRAGVAIGYAKTWGHVVVLKGAFTVIAAPDGRSILMPFANPALAMAGSGDVLAGTIAAMVSQGLPPFEAALCGAYLHGVSGELARREIGSAGVLAGDLLAYLPRALTALR
ncbi:Bifunctional NAD(P)H-hydrate repair enzyme Nnr [Planctomycetaceae bacterium]|nr:Bifunctional NAD(P)H-hydrate repair enzyme Nnr [Planctomycetaceae bacterium]